MVTVSDYKHLRNKSPETGHEGSTIPPELRRPSASRHRCPSPRRAAVAVHQAMEQPHPGKKPLGFVANAMKRKDSFLQLFFMTGVLLLSMRSLGQKYRINDLQEDNSALREENEFLSSRMSSIKESLLKEASLDPSGLVAARLRRLFGDSDGDS